MLKKLFIAEIIIVCLLVLQNSFASVGGLNNGTKDYPFYFQISGGYSFSLTAKLGGVAPPSWDAAVEGYDSDLGSAPSFGAGIGYHANPWLNLLISSSFRGGYHYKKFQTAIPTIFSFGQLPNKTRYFDLDNYNVMLSLIAHGINEGNMRYCFCNGMIIAPFIGGGIGVARNNVYNFHSVLATSTGGFADVASDMEAKNTYSIAAEGMLGLTWLLCDRFSFDIGYRFYYGGQFESNDYVIEPSAGAAATPWKGKLLANEAFINLRYDF